MAIMTVNNATFGAGETLAAKEIWQIRGGVVFFTHEASPNAQDGIEMGAGTTHIWNAGQVLKCRVPVAGTADAPAATIIRMVCA